MRNQRVRRVVFQIVPLLLSIGAFAAGNPQKPAQKPDIANLSQEFIDPKSMAPWIFTPQENIKRLDTTEHPGYVTIWEGGKGQDIKGVLKDPIKIDDYRLPWEFHLGLVQNAQAQKGISEKQINYAIGLNLALTFSDPSTWPKDRNQLPPDTHTLQVFVVHLGVIGENYRPGILEVRDSKLNFHDPSPEVYLVYGRGDLAPTATGNWDMPYSWVGPEPVPGQIESGSWSKEGGPSSTAVRFRVRLVSPTSLEVGFGYGLRPGWRMKPIDVSKFGKVTGVWEIGPIMSLDRWIPDVLAAQLGVQKPPHWLDSLESRLKVLGGADEKEGVAALERVKSFFKVEVPDPTFEYFVDYAIFYGDNPQSLEDFSSDFNIPGFLADRMWYQEGNAITETYSHPGHLTVTQYGNNGGWAMCPVGVSSMDLKAFNPPLEMEMAFTGPDNSVPWNIWLTPTLMDSHGKNLGQGWNPGVQNIPGTGIRYINSFQHPDKFTESPTINVEFDKPVPESILKHQPVYMLIQIVDKSHVRIGFRANKADKWYLSKVFDTEKSFGTIGEIQTPCIASFQGVPGEAGWGIGNYPSYQQIFIDYVHFRYGLSTGRQ
jgi:hypothetical protein